MATPADQRLRELLDKWLKSLELHLQYASLEDHSYYQIQPWPEHQRPSRWILDLAHQKTTALQAELEERVKTGDAGFSDFLELMMFLANLLGSEHIERFIPVADAASERVSAAEATGTREMPGLALGSRKTPAPSGAPTPDARSDGSGSAAATALRREAIHEQVIADATRLVQWGRKWYELAELISAMADRPSLIDVRRILQDNKSVIDKRAGRG